MTEDPSDHEAEGAMLYSMARQSGPRSISSDDIVKRLRGFELCTSVHKALAADEIERLCAEVERLTRERDEAREVITWANNSLFGSHGFFLSLNGGPSNPHHLDMPIENLKVLANKCYAAERQVKKLREALTVAKAMLKDAYILSPDITQAIANINAALTETENS